MREAGSPGVWGEECEMSMGQIEISVVTPVYNVKPYLRQCLDSLLAQRLPGIEFLCINDGSTDGSADILHDYARRDGRLRVIDKPNSGYGATMNKGLDEARGRYIGIVESDDFIEPSMMKKLHAAAIKHDSDMVKCNYYAHYDGRDHAFAAFKGFRYSKAFDPADVPNIVCTVPSIWAGIYKREMLVREGIRFRETPGAMFQDTGFTLKAWFGARSCTLLRKPLLHYRMDNPSSSSVSVSEKPFAVVDEISSAEAFLRERPERAERFLPWLHVDKLGKYRWCYERIVPESRLRFAEIVLETYQEARDAGELRMDLFSAQDRALIEELMNEGAERFVEAHPDRF